MLKTGGGERVDRRRILLIQLEHLGDVILTTPAIRAARHHFPDARIDFMTSALGEQVLEGNPNLDRILTTPSLSSLLSTRYNAVADMHCSLRTALYTFATRAEVRSGVRRKRAHRFAYTHLSEPYSAGRYMALQKLSVLKPLGVTNGTLELEVTVNNDERDWARRTLSQLRRPIIAISPVATHAAKQWGLERWAAVADAMAITGASVVITSGPNEKDQAQAVAGQMKHEAFWQYGSTTVKQLVALYEECSLWLGNDGGAKHMAVAARVPTVTVYRGALGTVWGSGNAIDVAINAGSRALTDVRVDHVLSESLRLWSSVKEQRRERDAKTTERG